MIGDFQKYSVYAKLVVEAEVFPEDPDDVYELAELEKKSIAEMLTNSYSDIEILELDVYPVIGE